MFKQKLIKVMAGAAAMGAMLVAAPVVTQAATLITSVKVTIGTATWCDTTQVGCTTTVWNLGGGVLLNPGDSLVLTQTGPGYNFDTSETLGTANIPQITINGVTFNDNTKILNNHGDDNERTDHQEAVDWTDVGTSGGIHLYVAYADDAHGGTPSGNPQCSDANHTCLPENPWEGTATRFIGQRVSGGCITPVSVASESVAAGCYDAGALRIELEPTRAPEPSVLLTLGTGLIAIATIFRKKATNRA